MIEKDGKITRQYGMELVLDLYGCESAKISSGEHIKQFVIKLCDEVIMMKRYGEPLVPHFGLDNPVTAGYSLVQLIETSSVTAHFSEYNRSINMNIFSCKWFDSDAAANFAKKWFGARKMRKLVVDRY